MISCMVGVDAVCSLHPACSFVALILACHEAHITVTLPKPLTAGAPRRMGASVSKTLRIWRRKTPIAVLLGSGCHIVDGNMLRRYWTAACQIVRSSPNARPDRSGGLHHGSTSICSRLCSSVLTQTQNPCVNAGRWSFPKVAAEMALSIVAYNLIRS